MKENGTTVGKKTGDELTAVFYFTQIQFTVKLSSKNRELHRIYTNSEIQGNN